MDSGKRRIIFIYKDFSHFVQKDYEILSGAFVVHRIRSPFGKSPLSFFGAGLKQFFALLWYIGRSDMIFCWFADYHSFLPALIGRITGKRFYLVLGGYDVTHVEELNYGSFNKSFRGRCTRYSMRRATLNLPVANALAGEARKRAGDIRIRVLPTGYDPELYLPARDKEEMILTVSLTSNMQRIMVKGIDRFIELAGLLPGFQFVIIGMDGEGEQLIAERPANLRILPPKPHHELLEWYGRARYYAQFSRSEGLPNAVCEAMLRNCIPLGVRTGGIPEAVGEAGIVLDRWDAAAMAARVRSCRIQDALSKMARAHIITSFHNEKREKELVMLLDSP